MSETQEMTYGEAAKRLDDILRSIEGGQADIDELSKLVDEAAGLVTLCRGKIEAAEVQVTKIAADLTKSVSPAPASSAEAPPLGDDDAPPLDDDDIPF